MSSLLKASLLAISLAIAGTSANAAPSRHHVRPTHIANTTSRTHVAYHHYDRVRLPPSIADLIDGVLAEARGYGYVVPAHINQANVHWYVSSGGGNSSDWSSSPSDDTATITDADNSASQAASDESNAIQAANDEAALNASMAAAEQQNDAANAAALQTEINANN